MRPRTERLEHYRLFDTAMGACGVAWSERGVTRLQLPEASPAATEARLGAGSAGPQEPPGAVARAIDDGRRYLTGRKVDFSAVVIDLEGVSPFHRQVYEAARTLGWGETVSYGELARRIGSPGAARAVGQALGCNPVPLVVPCHRILASGGRMGGFSAHGGTCTKERLLALEGVRPGADAPLLALMDPPAGRGAG